MPQKRRIYDDEFKRDAVRLVTHNSYGVSETADRLGISAKLLGRWKREAETRANGVFNGPVQVSPGPDELNQLRKENQRLRMERYTKKNGRLLRERIELRHAFIAAHQGQWPVAVLCEVLGVSRSGFYDYQSRQDHPKIDAEEVALLAQVKAIAVATRSRYGSRRMAKALQAKGFAVGRAKARRLMNEAGVQVRRAKRRAPVTTDSRHGYEVAPNLLARHFDVDAPDLAWGGDITYVWTAEGWLYVSTLLDLYSRKGVGWAMSSRINTQLVKDALEMALGRRRPDAGLIHHSDRGSQYASHAYRDLLKAHGMECSMSGKGDGLDNAVAERFFGSLKREWTSHRDDDTRQEARDDIIEYIEMFDNSTRKHSYLGYLSPNDYEKSALVLN